MKWIAYLFEASIDIHTFSMTFEPTIKNSYYGICQKLISSGLEKRTRYDLLAACKPVCKSFLSGVKLTEPSLTADSPIKDSLPRSSSPWHHSRASLTQRLRITSPSNTIPPEKSTNWKSVRTLWFCHVCVRSRNGISVFIRLNDTRSW